MPSHFQNKYKNEVRSNAISDLNLKNIHEVPTLNKICISVCLGKESTDKKFFSAVFEDISLLSGQKPIITVAKKSISSFQLRKDQNIGIMVTLRGEKMFQFLDRFVFLYLPRVQDFTGLKVSSFDSNHNYSIGIKSSSIFPECSNTEKMFKYFGLNLSFDITSKSKLHSLFLLKNLGLPIKIN